MKVKEVAHLVGISVRTLHHYDEMKLLVPDQMTEAGYRIYSDERFTNNINQFGEGLALFMRDAMAFYADKNKE